MQGHASRLARSPVFDSVHVDLREKTTAVSIHGKRGQWEAALKLFQELDEGGVVDSVLQSCEVAGSTFSAVRV